MELGVRLFGFFFMVLDYITSPIFWLISKFSVRSLPPLEDPLLLNSATKLADLIRNKEVSSQKIVEAFIQRVRDVNPVLNAVIEDRFSEAVLDAKNVDRLLNKQLDAVALQKIKDETPFLGVPFTVKESCALGGLSQCGGTLLRVGVKASQDGHAVATMKASGAIPLLVSNTPELCLSWESTNFVTGKTSNPYCLNRTSGGSSGGEAALIASGASVVGIASDIAGSIRIPAMFNGIFGHKPTAGLVSVMGHYPTSTDPDFSNFLVIGPLARYSEDLEPILKIMAGKNAHLLKLDERVNIKDIKITYMMKAGDSIVMIPVEKDIIKVMQRAINYLGNECGSLVEEAHFADLEDSVEISVSVFFGMKDLPNLMIDENDPKNCRNPYLEVLKTCMGMGVFTLHSLGFYLLYMSNLFIPRNKYHHYCQQAKELKEKIINKLGPKGVFLYPTFPTSAFYHNQVFVKPAGVLYTMLFNILGLPSTHVPLGFDSNGLPIGIQVIAAPNQDKLCLEVARQLEKGFGGWVNPSSKIS